MILPAANPNAIQNKSTSQNQIVRRNIQINFWGFPNRKGKDKVREGKEESVGWAVAQPTERFGGEKDGTLRSNKRLCAPGAIRAFRATPHLRLWKIIMTLPAASPNAIPKNKTSQNVDVIGNL